MTQTDVILRSDAVLSEDGIESGFCVDAQLPVAFDNMLNEVTAQVDESYSRLVNALVEGTLLTVKFTYLSPDKSPLETHALDIDLSEFDKAYEMFSVCE